MLLHIPEVLNAEQVVYFQQQLTKADWIDGKVTAGAQSAQAKNNQQLAENSTLSIELGDIILSALERSPLFISGALPNKVFPPLFNSYQGDQAFGRHVDNAIRAVTGMRTRIRTDLSATLFLADPDTYTGGELCIEDTYGLQSVKLAAGDMVLYPSSSLHHVTPVTQGKRIAAFFWIQSMIRDDAKRTLLFEMDATIQRMHQLPENAHNIVAMTSIYHNLLRMWAEIN
ncbi:MAG: Fe2+-dependent dioxygenase [Pseudomonadota bacterium]